MSTSPATTPPGSNIALPQLAPGAQSGTLPLCIPWQLPASSAAPAMYIYGCLHLSAGYACSANALTNTTQSPSCVGGSLNSDCLLTEVQMPPTSPNAPPVSLLGCASGAVDYHSFMCRASNPRQGAQGPGGLDIPCFTAVPPAPAATTTAAPQATDTAKAASTVNTSSASIQERSGRGSLAKFAMVLWLLFI